ncbi:hypothetical protein ACQVP2_07775 [Methylobacterium aquaticum]|uniref:hypothetical protein n=1 Tax=Methylobacterium aquaticum TaxID=270351 RepID=UPI003D176993
MIIEVTCETCFGTGNMTPGGGRNNLKDRCTTCGGKRKMPARTGETAASSWPLAVPGAQTHGPEIVRHIKSGGSYEVLFRGARIRTVEPLRDYDLVLVYRSSQTGQVTLCPSHGMAPTESTLLYMAAIQTGAPLSDGAEVVVYRALDGNLVWARPIDEMGDGRFELVSTPRTTEGSFQGRVDPWLIACFGEEIARDKQERAHRFLEEALEMVQAAGCTAHEAHQLVAYVFGRPAGEMAQEVGGVMTTLAAFCLAHGLDMHEAGETELARIWMKVEKIRAKQAAKPKHSPLPVHADSPPIGSNRWLEQDGWCVWPMSTSHVLRMALYMNGNAVATVEAFSMNGPWYANAVTPGGERERLGAGGSLHGAVAWCEKATGYLTPIAKFVAEQPPEGSTEGRAAEVRS